MTPAQIIEQREYFFAPDDFYQLIRAQIDNANPPAHMSADYLNDPLGCGLVMYKPRVYQRIEELKHGNPSRGIE